MNIYLNLTAVFLGGGAGSLMRYAVQTLLQERLVAGSVPWATLTVNVTGSFLIGLFYSMSARLGWPAEARLLLTTGLCGGFTTFSTFSNECLALMRQGHGMAVAAYITASIVLGTAAVFAGSAAGR